MNRLSVTFFMALLAFALNAQSTISGVFQVSEAELVYEPSLDYETFLAKNVDMSQKSYRLHDLESSVNSGEREFLGVWIKSVHNSEVATVHGWANFVKKKRAMYAEGYLLTEVEGYAVSNEEHHYLGVWVKKDVAHKVWKLDSREGLIQKTEEMARQDFFLQDVEIITLPNKTLIFLALYHKGKVTTPRNYVYVSDDLKTFKTSLLQREKSGFRMVDFEPFEEKDVPWYLGVFEKGDYNTVFLLGQDEDDFNERWDILEAQGMKLMDMEIKH